MNTIVSQELREQAIRIQKFIELTERAKTRLRHACEDLGKYRKTKKLIVHSLLDLKAYDERVVKLTDIRKTEQRFVTALENASKDSRDYEIFVKAYMSHDYSEVLK